MSFLSANEHGLSIDKLENELTKIFLNNKSDSEKEIGILRVVSKSLFDLVTHN